MDQLPDALEAATGPRPDDLDLPTLHRRARTRHLRRRATLATAALGLVAVTGIGVAAATNGGGAKAQVTASEGGPDATPTVSATDPCDATTTSSTLEPPATTEVPDLEDGATAVTETTTTTDPSEVGATEMDHEPLETTTTTAVCASDESTTTTAPPTTVVETSTTTSFTTTSFATTSTTTAPETADRIAFAGSFSGEGPIVDRDHRGCRQMHHHLDAAVTLDDGSRWRLNEQYCGVNENWVWSGEGTFTFTDDTGNSLGGTFTSRADVPTEGQPYLMTVTDGTGRFAGVTGTCDVANNVRDTAPGRSHQYGSFTCDLSTGAGPGT